MVRGGLGPTEDGINRDVMVAPEGDEQHVSPAEPCCRGVSNSRLTVELWTQRVIKSVAARVACGAMPRALYSPRIRARAAVQSIEQVGERSIRMNDPVTMRRRLRVELRRLRTGHGLTQRHIAEAIDRNGFRISAPSKERP